MNIELHIDELVLHGFAPEDRYRIGESVERELVQLIRERGLQHAPSTNVHIPALKGGNVQIGTDANHHTVGAEIARSVYGTIQGSQY
jgi:hypothetical protein